MRAAGWDLATRAPRDPAAMTRRAERIAELWDAGEAIQVIADDLGLSLGATQSQIRRMRRAGWHLPLRRDPAQRDAPVSDRIAAMRESGATIAQIAEALEESTSAIAATVSVLRAERGLQRRNGDGVAQQRRERIAALYRDGVTLGAIAQEVGGSATSIGATVSHLRARGWDLPPRQGRRPTSAGRKR